MIDEFDKVGEYIKRRSETLSVGETGEALRTLEEHKQDDIQDTGLSLFEIAGGKVSTERIAEIERMSTGELKKNIMWNGGGGGYGDCVFAGMMMQSLMVPRTKEADWTSVVAVSVGGKYTKEELEKLVVFSETMTARYDEMFS